MPIVAMHIYYNTPSQCFHVFKIMIFVEKNKFCYGNAPFVTT